MRHVGTLTAACGKRPARTGNDPVGCRRASWRAGEDTPAAATLQRESEARQRDSEWPGDRSHHPFGGARRRNVAPLTRILVSQGQPSDAIASESLSWGAPGRAGMIARKSSALACMTSLFVSGCNPIALPSTDAFSGLNWPLSLVSEPPAAPPPLPAEAVTTQPAPPPQLARSELIQRSGPVRQSRPAAKPRIVPAVEQPLAVETRAAPVLVQPAPVSFSCQNPTQSGPRVSVQCIPIE